MFTVSAASPSVTEAQQQSKSSEEWWNQMYVDGQMETWEQGGQTEMSLRRLFSTALEIIEL